MRRTARLVNYRATRKAWRGLKKSDHFAVRWTGYLSIKRAGSYRFYLTSDDGSALWIDGRIIVNNDGLHGMRQRNGRVRLDNTLHRIRMKFFENGGGAGIVWMYRGPDTKNRIQVVGNGVLWKKPNIAAQIACQRYGLKEEFFFFRQGRHVPIAQIKKR